MGMTPAVHYTTRAIGNYFCFLETTAEKKSLADNLQGRHEKAIIVCNSEEEKIIIRILQFSHVCYSYQTNTETKSIQNSTSRRLAGICC
jgi:hypothetical protein